MNASHLTKLALGLGALALGPALLANPTIERSVRVAPGGVYELIFNPSDNDVYVAAIGPRGAEKMARLGIATGGAVQSLEGAGLLDQTAVYAYPLTGSGAADILVAEVQLQRLYPGGPARGLRPTAVRRWCARRAKSRPAAAADCSVPRNASSR